MTSTQALTPEPQVFTDTLALSPTLPIGTSYVGAAALFQAEGWADEGALLVVRLQHSDDGNVWGDIVIATLTTPPTAPGPWLYSFVGLHTENGVWTPEDGCGVRLAVNVVGSFTMSLAGAEGIPPDGA